MSAKCLLSFPPISILLRYQGNNSKRWDGKEIIIDGVWLEDLYNPEDLVVGKEVLYLGLEREAKYENHKAPIQKYIRQSEITLSCAYCVLSELLSRCNIRDKARLVAFADSTKGIKF